MRFQKDFGAENTIDNSASLVKSRNKCDLNHNIISDIQRTVLRPLSQRWLYESFGKL